MKRRLWRRVKKWDRGKGDAVGGREPSNFPNAPGTVKGKHGIFSKACRSAVHLERLVPRRGGDGAAGLGFAAGALVLETGIGMEKSSSAGHFHGCSCRGWAWCAAFAVVQRWPQPWALRELAALHVIKFLTRHSPSLAPGMAASAKTPRDVTALRANGDIPGAGQSPALSRREEYVCGIPPWAAVLGERRKLVLGKAAAALPSLAPLARTPPDLGGEPWPRCRQPELLCCFAPRPLVVWFLSKK